MKNKVFEISKARKQKQNNLKREYERYLFNKFLGCYTVIEKLGLKSVEIVDISKSGLAFRLPVSEGSFKAGEEMEFRFYFSSSTYIPIKITIKRSDKVEDNGRYYYQFGGSFDKEWSTYSTIEKFVGFIESFSSSAKEDKGDKQIWFL